MKKQKATKDDVPVGGRIDLVVLSAGDQSARCRILGTPRELSLRSEEAGGLIPATIATVKPRRFWLLSGHPFVSGELEGFRYDTPALGLKPLALRSTGEWDPAEEYWGEEGEPLEAWAVPIAERGPRPEFEMEQVMPGLGSGDLDDFSHPIADAVDRRMDGDLEGAWDDIMALLAQDLRCLDAHAHLGTFSFEWSAEKALQHYRAGVEIGELSLGPEFDGALPWGWLDNRPFLRCLHGQACSLWRMGEHEEAAAILERLLWLNPSDNQGARLIIDEVREGQAWPEREAEFGW